MHETDRTDPRSVVTLVVAAIQQPPTRIVEHILFDLQGVLFDDSAWKRWVLGLLGHIGLHTHYTPFFRIWDREFQPDVWCGRRSFWNAFEGFLLEAGLTRPQIQEVVAATRPKLRSFEEVIRPFPGVPAALRELAANGVALTVTSRIPTTTTNMQACLERLGLAACLQEFLVTSESKFVDSREDYFDWLSDRRPAYRDTTAFVGRDPEDLAAAARQGMLTIAFNHDADAPAHLYLEQFDQLVAVVKQRKRRLLAAG